MSSPKILRVFCPWLKLTGLALLTLLSSTQLAAQGAQVDAETLLASQRFHYQKARAALAQNNTKAYAEHYAQLGDYPLTIYLEFGQLRRDLRNLPFEQIDAFIDQHYGSFLESRLRSHLLTLLASRERWADFTRYYQPGFASVTMRCHALNARLNTGDKSALAEVPDIWLVGQSQPDACDPVFRQWRQADLMTEALVWQRLHLAVQNNELSLARYLSSLLKEHKAVADLYFQVHNNPRLITQQDRFRGQNLPTQHVIAHGIRRLARNQPLDAIYHWELYEAQQLFPEELSLETKLFLVQRLVREGHAQEAQHLLSYSHALREQGLVEEIIRRALADQDWARVNESILLLDRFNQQSERWQYWRARAQDELDTSFAGFPPSQDVYASLAENRSFYGFISAHKLHKDYALVDDSSPVSEQIRAQVQQLDGMRRANELWFLGNTAEARAEWLHSSRSMNEQQLLAAGELARDWGWYTTGIQAMISGNMWNQLTVRFPLAFREQIDRVATDLKVEPTLIYAIARQESAFDSAALSPAGARGLMQIMPRTAVYTARKAGIPHRGNQDLLDAEHNMLLGGHYLNYLLNQYEGNRILAAAAYNAGPSRVNRWLSEAGKERPFDVWIETIPFRETRHYVQNVLSFSVIYGYRLGQPVSFISAEEAKRSL